MTRIAFGLSNLVGKKEGGLISPWSYDTKSSLLSSPIITDIDADGELEIIFGTKGGKIFVLNAFGRLKWEYNIVGKIDPVEAMFLDSETANSIEASPTIFDINGDGKKEIIFGSAMGSVYALDCHGKLIFKFQAKGGVRGQVLIADIDRDSEPEIIFGSSDKHLYILNNNGKQMLKMPHDCEIESSPAFLEIERLIVFGDNDGNVVAINTKGEEQWKYKTGGRIVSKPLADKLRADEQTTILVGSTDYNMYAFNAQGNLLWSYSTEGAICSEATVADINDDGFKEIVFGSCDNSVYALSHDGDRLWSYETNFWIVAKPLIADIDNDGKLEIVVGSYDHNINILDSEGSYVMDHIPGISGVIHQAGHYSEVLTSESGEHRGKKIWQYKTDGIIVGVAYAEDMKHLMVTTKIGKMHAIKHSKNREKTDK